MVQTLTQPRLTVAADVVTAIRTTGLCKEIDGRTILRDVNVQVRAGEYVALIGANGAGKSTLLRMLATLTPVTAGSIELFGEKLTRNAVQLRRKIGLIGHQSMLYRDLSAEENLRFFAQLYALPNACCRVQQMLQMVGMQDRAKDPVKNFSRGMVQRLSIARALLHDPELLLADEPFTGLDAPSMQSLEMLLQRLNGAGRTIVLVNHDIDQTLRIAERAIVLRGGRVALDQPTHRLYAREVLSEVM